MNVAIPVWCGRVSPVFDTAGRLVVVTVQDGQSADRRQVDLPAVDSLQRVEQVAGLGVDVLICGAVSQVLEAMLVRRGLMVISRVCGDAEEVLRCYMAGEPLQERFAMPGCCGRRGRRVCGGRRRRGGGPGGWNEGGGYFAGPGA